MDVDHVAFAGLRKFDGKRTRFLHPQEVGQIAGRAGRFRRDGTFGVTGECEDMDADLVEAVQEHRFEPVGGAEWRNAKLDFSNLSNLMRSLATPPQREGLKLAAEALDEATLRQLSHEEEVTERCARDRSALIRLWDVCQLPDFRKVSREEHVRLAREFFGHLTSRDRKVPQDWMAHQFRHLDRTDGEIDALAARLSNVRTLAYVANRPDWIASAAEWQARTRQLEDRLSDTLHEKLMARFVDRRTSALMRALNVRGEMLAGVGADGAVTVEGQYVGRLAGVNFEPAQGSSVLEEKALRAAAVTAVGPEIARRLGKMAAEPDEAFALTPQGVVMWDGEAAGAIAGGTPFAPRVRLYGELGPAAARERGARRLEAFVAAEAARRLAPLRRLEQAVADGRLKGLARGLAYRLIEAGGVLDRTQVRSEAKALSQVERRALKGMGVKLGAFSIYLPALLKPQALAFAQAFIPAAWRPPSDRITPLPDGVTPGALSAFGLRAVGGYAVPAEALERLDALLRAAPRQGQGAVFSDQAREELGWGEAEARAVLKGLNFAPSARPKLGEPVAWRRRNEKPERAETRPAPAHSPFAALAALKDKPPPARRPRRRRKPKQAQA
jgi:ATP-dependent RNA helicase SUPV3L1/SUV3